MNGFELVRRQPQLILKTGDSITGNLEARGNAKFVGPLQGNADTATRLQTPRTINGVQFDGTRNIVIQDNTKLPLTGGTVTGQLNLQKSSITDNGYSSLPNGLVEVWGTRVINAGSVETAKTTIPLPAGAISSILTAHAQVSGANNVYCTLGVVNANQIELDFRSTNFGGGLGVGLLNVWFRIIGRA